MKNQRPKLFYVERGRHLIAFRLSNWPKDVESVEAPKTFLATLVTVCHLAGVRPYKHMERLAFNKVTLNTYQPL